MHNTKDLRCGRVLERFPRIVARLQQILEQFLNNLYAMDATFISDETLDQLPKPSQVGQTRVGGVDVNKPRMQAVLSAALSLACSPDGFTARQFSAAVRSMLGPADPNYDPRRAAYDLKKLRGQEPADQNRRLSPVLHPAEAIRTIGALVILREKILRPMLAGVCKPKTRRNRTIGDRSTNTTKRCARACSHCLKTWALRHRISTKFCRCFSPKRLTPTCLS